jgi:hypothetical protein
MSMTMDNRPIFTRYIGIDYPGAKTPAKSRHVGGQMRRLACVSHPGAFRPYVGNVAAHVRHQFVLTVARYRFS